MPGYLSTVAAARPRLSLTLSGGPKFTAPQHLCRCHGVVRLPQQRAQLPCGTPFYLQPQASSGQHHKITVNRTCTHRDVDNIGVWRGAGALCHQTLLHARKSHSASLCITANAANRPPSCSCTVDKSTDSINSSDDTTASADMRSPAYCRFRCVASAATCSGARCRCHSAAAVSLCRCLPFSADPSAAPCTPWIVLHLLPDLLVRDRASSDVMATPRWTLRDSHTSRLVQSSRREGSAALSKFDLLLVFLHLHWCSYDSCQFVNLAQRVPFRQMSRQVPFAGNSLYKYSS